MKFIIVIFVLVAAISAYRVNIVENEWAKYKKNFGRNYDPKEDEFRMKIFGENLHMVQEHNAKYAAGEVTFEMELNEYSDWTLEEKKHLFGVPMTDFDKQWLKFKINFDKTYEPEEDGMRKEIFRKNLKEIEAHNKKYAAGEVSFEMAVNNFSDWTPEEMNGLFAYSAIDQQWDQYKQKFGKTYSEEEDAMRKELFRENFEMIEAHNKKYDAGEVSFTMALNQFSDWTDEERKQLLGFRKAQDTWESYKQQYGKMYTREEDSMRKAIFTKNVETIEAHNKKYAAGEVTWTMGLNEFSDWTPEELKQL